MSRNVLLYLTGIVVFVALAGYALWQELLRNEAELSGSLSGTILATPRAGAEIVKTDNAYLLLVDPDSFQIVATKVINPFLPPTTFLVGTDDAQGGKLSKQVRLLVLTDKDGDPNRPASGEVIGPLSPSYNLGRQGIEYTLDRPFQSFPPELLQSRQDAPEQSISGHITIADSLKAGVSPEDRLVVMLFDPKLGRPAAIRIIPHVFDGQDFRIGASDAMGGQPLEGPFSLRILTDKNDQPLHSAPGEVVGRSNTLIPLGTHGLEFPLDQSYVR